MKKLIFLNAKRAEAIQLPLSLDIDHYYKSEDNTIVDGLVSNITDTGLDANANFSQGVAANRPQYGYDKVGNYTAEATNLTFDGSNLVSSWANSNTPATSRNLGDFVQTVNNAKPLWNSTDLSVDFANGKSFN